MYTAVVIGATGAGNYGHDLDLAWQLIPTVEVVAVADLDEEPARAKADQLGARQAFGDFREMLHRVQADFVTVCLRRPHERSEMMLAAIESGARGIYCEKPFARTPAEADAIVDAAERGGTKIQVAHNWRVDPKVRRMLEMVRAGDIGRLVAMHATGKNDSRRGGAEDLAVLGVHQLDLMRQLAGDPIQLSANVMQAGRPVGIQNAREGNENLGLMAGDQIFASLLFDHGVTSTFSSVRTGRGMHRQMGIELVGTAGLLSLRGGPTTDQPLLINRRPELDPGVESNWEAVPVPPLDAEALGDTKGTSDTRQLLHTTMTRDLIEAVEQDRRPICDAIDGRWIAEMVMAVHEAGLSQQTVRFPLQVRENPYAARRQMALADDQGRSGLP